MTGPARGGWERRDVLALTLAALIVTLWVQAFPAEARVDRVALAMAAAYFVAAALGYLLVRTIGHRTLAFGWLVFTGSLLIGVLAELTVEPRLWNQHVPFAVGLTGLLFIGYGFVRVSRRHALEEAERRRVLADLERSVSTLRAVVEGTPDLVTVRDLEGRYLVVNSAYARFAGRSAEECLGKTVADLFPEQVTEALSESDRRVLETGETMTYEGAVPGETQNRTYLVTKGVYRDHRGFALGLLRVARDITDRKNVAAKLAHDALHDSLTGLPNRARFHEELSQAINRQRRKPGHLFGVLFMDLDRFKVINDSLGHAAGDELLSAFARTLRGWLRPTDMLARMGGDEFTILIDGMDGLDDATRVAERISAGLRQPLKVGDREIFVSVSIGIALSTTGYERPDDALRDADLALYRAKAAGRGRYAIFDVEMHARAIAHLELETDLRQAVERGEFRIAYQPIVALDTRRLLGFEALLRWQHPRRGLLGPAEFLSIADETGLIVPVGRWLLREACRQLAEWVAARPDAVGLSVSCNLSSRQLLHPQLVDYVREALDEARLSASRLRLEITESVIMEHAEAAVARLTELRDLGVQLDMDDFGTGYSSLSHLQRFPLQAVKIDRSFIERMRGGRNSEIVKAIFTLGRNLGLEVVAEGVETSEQHEALLAMGCPSAQGFLFSHPVLAEEAGALLLADAGAARDA